ncbi:unnamed protein product [Rotaria sp. Silwood2]|nr:unnamed protein product [Rotaria sp. Silwood2]CAF3069111.1 unnamed protein product [Rotaria sp. Silwood2]CAF3081075.1 unnamed protein product [Rotaria sp. Silwood2]CAF4153036.1 unnamed protein product [Rotaria sp. Silwood2]CAF4228004.1 unnamed protein product [Rotaria sp. Silwood2]
MGSGSSRKKKVDRQTQVSSAPTRDRSRTPSPPLVIRNTHHSQRPRSSHPSPWLSKTHTQSLLSNSNLGQYESIWERDGKLSSKFQELIKSGLTTIEHDQKETHHKELVTTHSSKYESAEVQSTLTSQFDSIHNLSTSERLDTLMVNLKQTHANFDEIVQHRIQQVTLETESLLARIVKETEKLQQDLLIQAKEQQTIEDEQYRLLLEEFIAKLDEKRAKQLAFIQEQLKQQRLQIFNDSQIRIRAVSEQANLVKNQIMSEEERKASEKVDSIVNEINSTSTDSAIQQMSTQIKTQINLTVYEKVGSNKSENDVHSDENDQKIVIKRTKVISIQA